MNNNSKISNIIHYSFFTINFSLICKANHIYGGVAQLARAPALQAGGQEFDSPHLHHLD